MYLFKSSEYFIYREIASGRMKLLTNFDDHPLNFEVVTMKKLVFIIEDDLVQQKILQVHFEQALGYTVRCFADPEEMIEHLEEKPFAIVLDHFFNHQTKTGLDYLAFLRKKYSSLPIIYYTSLNDESIKDQVMKSGAVQYIHKDPASLVRLRTALDSIHEKENKKGFFAGLFSKN
jgi:FixJ family two-component response regulator